MSKTGIVIFFALVITGFGFGGYFMSNHKTKVAFIDTAKVFNEFTLKKELEVKFIEVEKARKAILDSMFEKIKLGEQERIDINELDKFKREFLYKKQKFDEENQNTKSSYDTQIWNQLNQYIKEYGEEKEIEMILGANGQGNIMHAKESLNISKDIIEYINSKYSGKQNTDIPISMAPGNYDDCLFK